MPARSVSWASRGEKGALRLSLMVSGSTTSTLSTDAELGLAERALHVEVAIEAVFGRLRVEGFAVMELHAGAELDGDRLAVGRSLVAEGELRHDGELLVDVEQLVADRGEDDAGGIGAGKRRIEHVGIIAQPDAQVALGGRAAGGHGSGEREGEGEEGAASCLSHGLSVISGRDRPLHAPCHRRLRPAAVLLGSGQAACATVGPSPASVVRRMSRGSWAGKGRARCMVWRLSHITRSPIRHLWV